MHSNLFLSLASAALLGTVHAVTYQATLPATPFFAAADLKGNVNGSIEATTSPDCRGVEFTVRFSNLPTCGGPFPYHIHALPAPNGNCTATKAHLDPTNRGENPPCDSTKPETCQVGDLSGKYGKITSDPFVIKYTDPYLSLDPASPNFFGSLSFVLHYANKTRLTCANFAQTDATPPTCVAPSNSSQSTTLPPATTAATPAATTVASRSGSGGNGAGSAGSSAGIGAGGSPVATIPASSTNGAQVPNAPMLALLLALGAATLVLF